MTKLSIIVPVYNEAALLPQALQQLRIWQQKPGCEVIIVDGDSPDDSAAIISQAGFKLVESDKGRSKQMNCGAAVASGEVFVFLHIDTELPANADKLIGEQAVNPAFVWGRFDVRFDTRHWLLAVVSHMINWRSRIGGIATGDQALFVRAESFRHIGGFTEQPLMEDIDLSRRLLHISSPVCLQQQVTTSARRWQQHGIIRTIILMWRLRYLYWRGTPADKLAREYV